MAYPHKYDSPELQNAITDAVKAYEVVAQHLHKIQELTGIPGLHAEVDSDDDTPGVLERIQAMHDEGSDSLEAFRTFD